MLLLLLQDNRRRGLTVVVPLMDIDPALGPTQVLLATKVRGGRKKAKKV